MSTASGSGGASAPAKANNAATGTATAAAAAAAPAASSGVRNVGIKMATVASNIGLGGWIGLALFIVSLGFFAGNIGLLASLAGSKDDWDSIKTKMGGSISLCFIGALFFAIALCFFVYQYNLGNLLVPILACIVVSSLALAIGLSALGVAAITR